MVLYNASSFLGNVTTGWNSTTGSIAITLTFIILAIIIMSMFAGLPIETSLILVFPVVIVAWAITAETATIGSIFAIYLAIVFARHLPFSK